MQYRDTATLNSTGMADAESVQLLSILHKQLGLEQFEQAKLFLQCICLGGEYLDSAQDLLDLHRIVSSDLKYSEALAVAIVKFILLEIGVADAERLIATSDNIQKAVNLLMFPTLLIELCRRLGRDDYQMFKSCICSAVLMCNPKSIRSRVDLMKKLLHQLAISSGNVDVLIKWLSVIGRKDLTKIVEEYKLKSLQQSTSSNYKAAKVVSPGASECLRENANPKSPLSQELVLPGGIVTVSHVDLTASELACSVGVSQEDLTRHVLKQHLKEIADCIPCKWREFMGQSIGVRDLIGVVSEWYEIAKDEATYRALVDEFCSKGQTESATVICKLAKVKFCFCMPMEQQLSVYPMGLPHGAQAGSSRPDRLWDATCISELKVHFMNPELLGATNKIWLVGNEQLTVETILAWATDGWNRPHYPNYPRISSIPSLNVDESHIRVAFGTTGVCWSRVGRDAQNYQSKCTMYLNLYKIPTQDQLSLILHEFGHALGLDHEHQRSDFWDVLQDLLAYKPKELPHACDEHLRFSFEEGVTRFQTDYDPKSIMHYWFKIDWLLPQYRNLEKVKAMTAQELPEHKRKVIEGVHLRDYKNGVLAQGPSQKDYEALNELYKLTCQ